MQPYKRELTRAIITSSATFRLYRLAQAIHKEKANGKAAAKQDKANKKAKARAKAMPKATASVQGTGQAKAKAKSTAQPTDPARSARQIGAFEKDGEPVTWEQRVGQYPGGCVRCRWAEGCAVSCWARRRLA